MKKTFRSEPVQIDLEEYIAAKGGKPYQPSQRAERQIDMTFDTLRAMYAPLHGVLMKAYEQAMLGKGMERHANGKPFEAQPMMEIGRMVGMGYHTGQAMKKSQEAGGMVERSQFRAAQAELLGAINYLAGAYLLIDEISVQQDVDEADSL